MRWRRRSETGEKLDQGIRLFLQGREDRCVAACGRYLRFQGSSRLQRGRDELWTAEDERGAVAALVLLAGGVLHPVLGDAVEDAAGGLVRILSRIADRVRSVQGVLDEAERAESALAELGRRESEKIDYRLLGLDGNVRDAALERGPPGLEILRFCGAEEELYPLQSAYEREEVLPKGAEFHPASCRLGLRRMMDEQTLFAARLDGRIVAKANTNGASYRRSQIGGVYVLPDYRGRGIGTRMVAELAACLRRGERGLTLFVKSSNIPALAAYRTIGFDDRGPYRISYYR